MKKTLQNSRGLSLNEIQSAKRLSADDEIQWTITDYRPLRRADCVNGPRSAADTTWHWM